MAGPDPASGPARGPATIRIAAAQYPIERLANVADLKTKLTRWVEDAMAGGADMIVFPEYGAMELAGMLDDAMAGDLKGSLAAVAERLPDIDEHLAMLARKHGAHILAPSGPSRRGDGTYVNAARLMAPSGAIGVQEKMMMTPFERDWGISGGGPLRVFATALGRIGVLICYDSEFPLLARAQVEAGARLLLVPSCTERLSGFNRVRTAALARALEGSVATATSALVGAAPWSPAVDRNAGAAGVFVPAEVDVSETGILAEGMINEPGFVHAVIPFDRLEQLRARGEMRNLADWALQPGARPLPAAEVTELL